MERKTFPLLLVEDSPMDARLLRESLRDALERGELALQAVRSIGEAIEELGRNRYACVLLDLGLPDGQGLANVEKLRELDRSMTVVVLTGLDCESSAIRALQLGAQEYVVKGQYDGDSLLKVIRHATERNRQLHELEAQREQQVEQASNDPVTGLANRQRFEDKTRQLLAAAQDARRFAVCFLDLDRFKAVNDRHGHAIGDALLARIAQILRESVRESDTIARLGGDEFAILLPSIGEVALAREIGHRIVERIRGMVSAALSRRDDVLLLCHGGPIAEPADAAYVIERVPELAGFYGASSMERLPTEVALTERTREFGRISRGGGTS